MTARLAGRRAIVTGASRGIVAICGRIESSIDLLEREAVTVTNLQGSAPHPNGYRR